MSKQALTAKQKKQRMCEELVKRTHFKKHEVEYLFNEYHDKVIPQRGQTHQTKMDRTTFRDILHEDFGFTDDVLMDRIFRAFDLDNDSYISMEEWVKGLSVFLRGQEAELLKFCFSVYDLNADGYISREEMFQLLKKCLVKQTSDEDPDEGVKDLVELTIKKLDHDNDHRVNFEDFEKGVTDDPLLMETFGSCLPQAKSVMAYQKKFEV